MNAKVQTIAVELGQDFERFQDSVFSWDEYDRAVYADLHDRAQTLAKLDVTRGNMYFAKLASAIGDTEQVERWCRNIDANNKPALAAHTRLHHFVNLGYATKGQELLPRIFSERGASNLASLASGAIAVGAFSAAHDALQTAKARGEELAMPEVIEKIHSAFQVVDSLGINDAEIARMYDEAGKIVREQRMNWASNSVSIVALQSSEGGPAISIEWPIMVTPTKAAQLTWDLTDRLVDMDLDRPGFSLGFLGLVLK